MNQVLYFICSYFILFYMPEVLIFALCLAIAYQLKHFLADYVFQTDYMMKKGNADWSFFVPLMSHTLVHGGFTFLIAIFFLQNFFWAFALMAFDTLIHFFMDRLKASPRYLGRYHIQPPSETSPEKRHENQLYWITFGFDQMVHHLTHICIVALLIYIKFVKS